MGQVNLTPLSAVVDEVWGEKGTPRRDAMEKQLKDEVNSYRLGAAMREARLAQNLTQDELGRRIGVQRSQICRLESGRHARFGHGGQDYFVVGRRSFARYDGGAMRQMVAGMVTCLAGPPPYAICPITSLWK